MRHVWLIVLVLLGIGVGWAAELRLPANGGELRLAPDDYRLELQKTEKLQFVAPELGGKQVVLAFRVRIDAPGTIGSTNLLRLDLNGTVVGLKTPRRQMRLLNKPSKFAWSDPPSLNWFVPPAQWRLAYAPDFEVLKEKQYYGAAAYEWVLDVTDLVKPGENELVFTHTGNPDIARNAKSDLTVVFRDLRLEVRPGPGVLPGTPVVPDRNRPFVSGTRRSGDFRLDVDRTGALVITTGGHRYALSSEFSVADDSTHWLQLSHGKSGGTLTTNLWRLVRKVRPEADRGRILITDTFTNLRPEPVGIRINNAMKVLEGRCERVSFGGREEAGLEELSRPAAPYLFLPRERGSVGVCAYDDVLRQQGMLYYDDETQTGGLRDDWFGLPAGGTYTMTWAVYCTASPSVFDLVNLIRRDWSVSFRINGGYNFFEPDRILEYDDAKLKEHLDRLNINVTMSQGGWVDFKKREGKRLNCGHGPIVAGDFFADYRTRLRAACEKLRRLRPGIKCLIYYDSWIVTGNDIATQYADSMYTGPNGKPRKMYNLPEIGFPLANVIPTLENTMGRESLEKIPSLIMDELGADGLYWDEIAMGFLEQPNYAVADGYTYVIDQKTGAIKTAVSTPELGAQGFKLAFAKAFLDRGKDIVGNSPPETMTEQKLRFARFTETEIPGHPGLPQKTWLYTPICYAGWTTYKEPKVSEADFLADIKSKLWQANLYLYSAPGFYHLFTHENLATYEYPITVTELDEGVVAGKERIITLRSGRFGWPGEKWRGELLMFDPEQKVAERRRVEGGKDGCVAVDLKPDWGAVVVRQ
ncbi:MAG: hypothetical protein ABFD96_09345 [Armatimonadia bacterium]